MKLPVVALFWGEDGKQTARDESVPAPYSTTLHYPITAAV